MLKAEWIARCVSRPWSLVVLERWSEVVRKPASGQRAMKANGSRRTSASMSVMTTSNPQESALKTSSILCGPRDLNEGEPHGHSPCGRLVFMSKHATPSSLSVLSARGSVAPTNQLVMPSLRTWCTHVRAKSTRTILTKERSSFLSTAMGVTRSMVNE